MTAGLIPCRNAFIQGQKLLCCSNSPVMSFSTWGSALWIRVRSTAGSKKADPKAQNPRFECILKSEQARAPKPSSSLTEGHFKQLKTVCLNRGRRLSDAMAQDAALLRRNLSAFISASHPEEPEPDPEQRESWLKGWGIRLPDWIHRISSPQ